MRKTLQVLLGIAIAAALVVGAYVVVQREYGSPEVDAAVKREVAPTIQSHLENAHFKGGAYKDEGGRHVCDVTFVETREKGGDLLVGTHTACQEYVRKGKVLRQGTGVSMPMLVTLRTVGGKRQVVNVREPQDGAGFSPTVKEMFTRAGARKAMDLEGGESHDEDSLHRRARELFGLPADAPVEKS